MEPGPTSELDIWNNPVGFLSTIERLAFLVSVKKISVCLSPNTSLVDRFHLLAFFSSPDFFKKVKVRVKASFEVVPLSITASDLVLETFDLKLIGIQL